MNGEALYPFGYGLSYTRFEYTDIKLAGNRINAGESVTCSVTVTNIGNFESDEVVQLYLKDLEASVNVPRWQLQGFKKIHLQPGESLEVSFTLSPRQMALINNEGQCILEPGIFEIYLGGSQPDKRSQELTQTKVLKATFEVTGEPMELEY